MILFAGKTLGAEQVELILRRRTRGGDTERTALWDSSAESAPALFAVAAPAAQPAAANSAPVEADSAALDTGPVDLRRLVADMECKYISEALRVSDGVVADAARLLSLQRTTLIEKMRKHGLPRAA